MASSPIPRFLLPYKQWVKVIHPSQCWSGSFDLIRSRVSSQFDGVRIILVSEQQILFSGLPILYYYYFFFVRTILVTTFLHSFWIPFNPNFIHNILSTPSQVRFSSFLIGYNFFLLFPFLFIQPSIPKLKKKKKQKKKVKVK